MECRAGYVVLAVALVVLASPPSVRAQRRRVVIEVPVHIRSHQHTHTVYRQLPAVAAAAPVPALPAAPPPAAYVYPQLQQLHARPATLVSAQPAAQRVAHHAAPGGLTSITLVNLGRGGGGGAHHPADDGGEGNDAEELPQHRQLHQQQQHHLHHHQQQQQQQHNPQRHHITGVNYHRTEHTAQVYR